MFAERRLAGEAAAAAALADHRLADAVRQTLVEVELRLAAVDDETVRALERLKHSQICSARVLISSRELIGHLYY